ncbi:MAG: hypothetical protein BroJett018_05340 [Chloroflexota bacterium]|nr:DUF4276 family protein [Chloroflexota bacterium]NOG63549.1 DUF4276 family protein [Chloroflexota bacterium]GIK62740.1 MAG: hypothetical protein BroJett018_05340 [Chloroflexota bacterium]
MRNISLFTEDLGHEEVLKAVLSRFAREYGVEISVKIYSVRGGHGKVISELKQYLRDLHTGESTLPDLVVIGTDANCKGYRQRRQEVENITENYSFLMVCALPDPHIERWLLLDGAAFKKVLGKGCNAPDQKCERDRYKRYLLEAVRNAGVTPLLGGLEHAQDIVNAMDFPKATQSDDSLKKLLNELHMHFKGRANQ